jgi:hypothetical protein
MKLADIDGDGRARGNGGHLELRDACVESHLVRAARRWRPIMIAPRWRDVLILRDWRSLNKPRPARRLSRPAAHPGATRGEPRPILDARVPPAAGGTCISFHRLGLTSGRRGRLFNARAGAGAAN